MVILAGTTIQTTSNVVKKQFNILGHVFTPLFMELFPSIVRLVVVIHSEEEVLLQGACPGSQHRGFNLLRYLWWKHVLGNQSWYGLSLQLATLECWNRFCFESQLGSHLLEVVLGWFYVGGWLSPRKHSHRLLILLPSVFLRVTALSLLVAFLFWRRLLTHYYFFIFERRGILRMHNR